MYNVNPFFAPPGQETTLIPAIFVCASALRVMQWLVTIPPWRSVQRACLQEQGVLAHFRAVRCKVICLVQMVEKPVNLGDFFISSVELVAFLADRTVTSARVMSCVLKKFAELFDGEPQAIPLPPDVPADVPRVILKSEKPGYVFQAGPARMSCSWAAVQEQVATTVIAVGRCSEVMLHCLQSLQPQINRLALIIHRASPADDPATMLIEQFCSKERQAVPFNRSSTFEIHNHKQYLPEGLGVEVNSWVRCRTGMLLKEGRPAVLVEQDLNTVLVPNSATLYDAATAERFYGSMAREADEILSKYFPLQIRAL